MKLLDKIYTSVESFVIERAGSSKIFSEYYNRTTQKADWKRQATTLRNKEIKDFKLALTTATDPDNPRRGELMRLYQSFETDTHLYSCVDQRILPIQCAEFKLVNDKGEEDLEAHMLLEKPWFLDLIRKVVMSTFTGTTLIELFDLNENMEVKEVGEIPQSNFIPQSGVILREEWDTNGVSYRDGAYKDYYFQVGPDNNLGLFYQLSIIIMAKKLGLGSWLAYVDKFGVPPVFVTTDRMDSNRVDELFEMMTNFRSNFFTILQGNEKIEMPQGQGVDAHNTFKSLFDEIGNNEISKRMLGGTGTTTEKSFVGSSEVHERMLKMRNKVDKLLFKFYFNEEIKPRLVKLSPVYAPLDKLRFEFDETETLTLKELIATIKDLSQYYEFDIDELVKITGLPITKIRGIIAQGTEPTPPTGQKKKPNANVGTGLAFAPYAKSSFSVNANTWDAATEQIARKIYSGELKPEELHKEYVLNTYDKLVNKAQEVLGNEFYGKFDTVGQKMRNNLMEFSGFKAYNMMNQFHELKNGNFSEEEYLRQARRIADLHNGAYADAEINLVSTSSTSVYNWQQYVDDIHLFPNLKYRTMEDEDVRESHRLLDGIIRPVNDPFWDTHNPPNGWRCRCDLDQTDEPATAGEPPKVYIHEMFRNNAGKTGIVFGDSHNYYKVADNTKSIVRENIERIKLDSPYYKLSDKLKVSHFADPSEKIVNIDTAKIIIKNIPGSSMAVRPHVNITGNKNPEYIYNGDIADAKRIEGYNGIKYGISEANEQQCNYVIFDFNMHFGNAVDIDFEKIQAILGRKSRMHEARNMKGYMVVWKDKAIYISSDEAKSGDFMNLLKKLKP